VTSTTDPKDSAMSQVTNPEVHPSTDEPILAEDLVEEVSIDGMCGVY
jgi:mycofactocin precursor